MTSDDVMSTGGKAAHKIISLATDLLWRNVCIPKPDHFSGKFGGQVWASTGCRIRMWKNASLKSLLSKHWCIRWITFPLVLGFGVSKWGVRCIQYSPRTLPATRPINFRTKQPAGEARLWKGTSATCGSALVHKMLDISLKSRFLEEQRRLHHIHNECWSRWGGCSQ